MGFGSSLDFLGFADGRLGSLMSSRAAKMSKLSNCDTESVSAGMKPSSVIGQGSGRSLIIDWLMSGSGAGSAGTSKLKFI